MRDALESFYQQKVISLHERLNKENSSWNVMIYLSDKIMFHLTMLILIYFCFVFFFLF